MDKNNIFTPLQQRRIAEALGRFHRVYSWDDLPTASLGVRAVAELLEFAVDPMREREDADLNGLAVNSRYLRELIADLFTPDVEAIAKRVNEEEEREIREAKDRREGSVRTAPVEVLN